jgi:hypothetical protein
MGKIPTLTETAPAPRVYGEELGAQDIYHLTRSAAGAALMGASLAEAGKELTTAGQKASTTLGGFADVILEYEKKQAKARKEIDLAWHVAKTAEQLDTATEELKQDPDYRNKTEKWNTLSQTIYQQRVQAIDDPEVSQAFQKKWPEMQGNKGREVRHAARRQENEDLKAKMNDSLEIYERLIPEAKNDVEQFNLVKEYQETIIRAQAAGVITAVDAQKRIQEGKEKIAEAGAMRAMRVQGPERFLADVEAGKYKNLDPKVSERLLHTATRLSELNLKQNTTAWEKLEKQAEKLKEKQEKEEEALLQAGIIKGNLGYQDLETAYRQGKITARGYLSGTRLLERDIDRQLKESETWIDHWFRTAGILQALDPVNEKYRADLKMEMRNRVNGGEAPERAFQTILQREFNKPKDLDYYPRPMFFEGEDTNLEEYKKAMARTVEAATAGHLDQRTTYYQKILIEARKQAAINRLDAEAKAAAADKKKKKR